MATFNVTLKASFNLPNNNIGINTFNGALDDVYKELYLCRFYNKDKDNNVFVDKRRKLDDGSVNPNRDKKYWILENRKIE